MYTHAHEQGLSIWTPYTLIHAHTRTRTGALNLDGLYPHTHTHVHTREGALNLDGEQEGALIDAQIQMFIDDLDKDKSAFQTEDRLNLLGSY